MNEKSFSMAMKENQPQLPARLVKEDDKMLQTIDDEIRRTEVSIREVNERFVKMRSQSPILKTTQRSPNPAAVPVYEANLFRTPPQVPKVSQVVPFTQQERPLMTLRIDLGARFGQHLAYLLKDDISSS